MSESEKKRKQTEPRWRWYIIAVIVVPLLIPLLGIYLRRRGVTDINLQTIAGAFMIYWVSALLIAGWIIRKRFKARLARLGSPLVDLELTSDLRNKLAEFAAARRQTLTLAAFDLLDRELPRGERDKDAEELERVREENIQLAQIQTPAESENSISIAVTIGILRRLLLLNGADEENRHLWRKFASETAGRIIGDALNHLDPRELHSGDVVVE